MKCLFAFIAGYLFGILTLALTNEITGRTILGITVQQKDQARP